MRLSVRFGPGGQVMQTLDFKSQCKILRKKGYTLGEIVQETGRPKTSVFFHINKIPKTKQLRLKIREIKIKSIKGKGPVKGKSMLGRHYDNFKVWIPENVNLFAHVIFDGSIRNTGISYYNRSQNLIDNFSNKMKRIYKYDPKVYKKSNGVFCLAYYNVELAPFFRNKISQLLSVIVSSKKQLQKEFLSSFFDDEGSVDFRKSEHIRRIRGYQHNNEILMIINKLLKNLNIESKVDTRFHEIIISRRENIEKFAKEINFSKGVKVNGKRSNSVWKRSLEKRKILANLLTSYQ